MCERHQTLPGISSRRTPFLAVLLAAALAGCMGTGGQTGDPIEEGARGTEQIELLVRNNNFNQATVYTSPEHGSKRLGVVRGKSEATFRLEWHLPYLQLRIKFLAGSTVLTETLSVDSDDRLELIIPAT
ncbi:MAG: hypothetical protein OXQ94_04300 [Gemmatimonadota bacterium]|nr:hypothetical protein [Gemmatimonadota bacterium]MDE2870894.1 hypothetical protein [Gemmatimonadota bacterium]